MVEPKRAPDVDDVTLIEASGDVENRGAARGPQGLLAALFRAVRLPATDDEDRDRAARTVATITAVSGMVALAAGLMALAESVPDWSTAAVSVLALAVCGTCLFLVYRRGVTVAAWTITIAAVGVVTTLVATGRTRGFDDIAMMLFPVLLIMASLLLNRRGFLLVLGLVLAALGGLLAAELSGVFGPVHLDLIDRVPADFGFAVLIVLVSAVTSRLLAGSLKRSVARARHHEKALATANRRLAAEANERERLIEELEARNAELERFAYTISHDLKTPLVTIGGFLPYLERHAIAGEIDRFRVDLARIHAARTKMARLLDELLELSRIGRVMNPPEDVPFDEIVAEALDLVAGTLEKSGVRVVAGDGLPVVRGDRVRLVEVVQNLVDNAAKSTEGVADPTVAIGVDWDDGNPVFFVRDNGVGIEPEYHSKIFGLFETLDPTKDGTGIGLALVCRIVEVHGGRIWVESEGKGRGATFRFTL